MGGHADAPHALEDVEVNGLAMRLDGDEALCERVPHDQVGVAALGYVSLARIHVEHPGRIGARRGHKLRGAHLARGDAAIPRHSESLLEAVHAARYERPIVLAKRFLIRIERAMVAAHRVEVAVGERVGERAARRRLVAQRRRAHVAGRVTPTRVIIVGAVGAQASGERLGEHDRAAAAASVGYLPCGESTRHAAHVERAVELMGRVNGAAHRLELGRLGPRQQMSLGTGDAERLHALGRLLDERPVLGMHERQCAELLAALEESDELRVTRLVHVQLERVDAVLVGQHAHVDGRALIKVPHTHVKGVVATRLRLGARLARLVCVQQAHLGVILQHKVDFKLPKLRITS